MTRENGSALLNVVGALVTGNAEKAVMPSTLFASVITAKTASRKLQILEENERVWKKEDFPLVEKELVRNHLRNSIYKSMGPSGMHP